MQALAAARTEIQELKRESAMLRQQQGKGDKFKLFKQVQQPQQAESLAGASPSAAEVPSSERKNDVSTAQDVDECLIDINQNMFQDEDNIKSVAPADGENVSRMRKPTDFKALGKKMRGSAHSGSTASSGDR